MASHGNGDGFADCLIVEKVKNIVEGDLVAYA